MRGWGFTERGGGEGEEALHPEGAQHAQVGLGVGGHAPRARREAEHDLVEGGWVRGEGLGVKLGLGLGLGAGGFGGGVGVRGRG